MLVPDRVGVVRAARAWRWSPMRGPGEPRLEATTRAVSWPPRRPLEASCIARERWMMRWSISTDPSSPVPVHEAPQEDCYCGIWGLASGEQAVREHRGPADSSYVFGVVALWGPLLAGPAGWRARYGYPLAFVRVRTLQWSFAPCPPLEALARVYGVPVLDDWPSLTPPLEGDT